MNDTGKNDKQDSSAYGEAYLDIVWKQYKKNRAACVSLALLAPLLVIAIFAPAIASNQPFVFHDGDETVFPWIRSIFNPEQPIDFLFNMAMLAFFPWLLVAIATNLRWKKNNVPGRRRVLLVSGQYLLLTGVLCVIFSVKFDGEYLLRPTNKFRQRTFSAEQFETEGKWAIYPPVPFGPVEIDLASRNQPPFYSSQKQFWKEKNDGFIHTMGTDTTGRDVFTRMLYGSRTSMSVGFVAVGIYMSIGIVIGAIAGYFGGFVDILISRVIEIVLLFPAFFLILTLVALIGPSIYVIMVVIGITGWPRIARLIRGEVLKQRAIDYTEAARALGASHGRIIFRHILPNAVSPAMVAAPFGIASAIITEAGLSLLGFGVRPPAPSWGAVLQLAHGNYSLWWLIVIPSVAMFFAVTVYNLIGSGLRDAMDPKLRA